MRTYAVYIDPEVFCMNMELRRLPFETPYAEAEKVRRRIGTAYYDCETPAEAVRLFFESEDRRRKVGNFLIEVTTADGDDPKEKRMFEMTRGVPEVRTLSLVEKSVEIIAKP